MADWKADFRRVFTLRVAALVGIDGAAAAKALWLVSSRAKRRIGVAVFMATCHNTLPAHDVDERC